jgi:hypothetical protein
VGVGIFGQLSTSCAYLTPQTFFLYTHRSLSERHGFLKER